MPRPDSLNADAARRELVELIRQKAENQFAAGRYLCAASVLSTINQSLGGGLDNRAVEGLTAGLPEGLGGAGCLCGALSGASLAAGLMLGGAGISHQSPAWAGRLHHDFKLQFGSTCCRVLSKPTRGDAKAAMKRCEKITGAAAALAAEAILNRRPDLIDQADRRHLAKRDGKIISLVKRVLAAAVG